MFIINYYIFFRDKYKYFYTLTILAPSKFYNIINNLFNLNTLKYLGIIYKIFLYFYAMFGAGIIIFYVNPFNDLLNSIINLLKYYNDNDIVNFLYYKTITLLRWTKSILDYLSNYIDSNISSAGDNIISNQETQNLKQLQL